MKKTTFFTIAAIIFLLMASTFTVQVKGLALKKCTPTNNCDVLAEMSCHPGGDFIHSFLIYAACEAQLCVGTYSVTCEDSEDGFLFTLYLICEGSSNECNGW